MNGGMLTRVNECKQNTSGEVFVCTQLWLAVHVSLFLSTGMTLLLTLLLSYSVVDASLRLTKNNFNKIKYYVCMKIGRKIMVLILNEFLLYI